ncbi:hypothetical protein EV641_109214 [Rhodococcus sp. SMB37]|uniref:hypothetical protein n=1 Tax=Rhodococcus sp. SMB37 TaxID=2512213 RepID=UPI0010EBCFFC|nr:hypothetical protein [Rhodococcus sp. SMB37]TCN51823.1 hypothetical protein EV641_109214 [Rhodococcus sp. SMB37]
MSNHLHSLLAKHYRLSYVFTHGHQINGFAPRGCLACQDDPHYLELVDILFKTGGES